MAFEPIAIVGRACVLPGALTPESFYAHLRRGQDFVKAAPDGRWRLDPELAVNDKAKDGAWSDRGGYVQGFEFDASDFGQHASTLELLDPLFHWAVQTGKDAWFDAGFELGEVKRAGVILGHLSFPSESMTAWAEQHWMQNNDPHGFDRLGLESVHPSNRFMSGYPALLTAEVLGVSGTSYCLDAACASSLYAIAMAANELHTRRADVMVAGALQRADSLFLHVGFCALNAMSKSGQSRPFHAGADGLIPSEGAASMVLMRLEDAVAQGRKIHGVIRGVGLSNDGRSRGFLAPSSQGQQAAIRAAYKAAELSPSDIQYVECHATGTILGDRTELESMADVWGEHDVWVGSHKSNMGHAITTAGLAGTLKVLESMKEGVIPRTIHLDQDQLSDDVPKHMHILCENQSWYNARKRRAAVSAFGFGGNNAHMILEQWSVADDPVFSSHGLTFEPETRQLAVVAMEVCAGDCDNVQAFSQALFDGESMRHKMEHVQLDLKGIKFPPKDMEQANAQQWLMLKAARAVATQIETVDWDKTSVLIGMQCDTSALRYGARWRLAQWQQTLGYDATWLKKSKKALTGPLKAQGVVGTMPNIPANRINAQFDAQGPSFTVSSEELSGLDALLVASDLLHEGHITSALVGAVEIGADALHEVARKLVLEDERVGLDAAVALIVKTVAQANADGDEILATVTPKNAGATLSFGEGCMVDTVEQFGSAHSAQCMIDLATAILSVRHGLVPFRQGFEQMWLSPSPTASLCGDNRLSEREMFWSVEQTKAVARVRDDGRPQVVALSGESREAIREKLNQGLLIDYNDSDTVRLGCVVTPSMAPTLLKRLFRRLDLPEQGVRAKVALFDMPIMGDVAFVYPPSGSAAVGAVQNRLLASIDVSAQSRRAFEEKLGESLLMKLTDASKRSRPWSLAEEDLIYNLSLSMLHTQWSMLDVGIAPDMVSGVSLGESSALFSLGVWDNLSQMVDALVRSQIFERDVVQTYDALRMSWFNEGHRSWSWAADPVWRSHQVVGPVDLVRKQIEAVPGTYLTIIRTSDECLISGYPKQLKLVLGALENHEVTFIVRELEAMASVHADVVNAIEPAYKTLHKRDVHPQPFKVYGHGQLAEVKQTSSALSQSIYDQAHDTVDFPAMVHQLYRDGARIFIEHGPGGSCARWISHILGDHPHLVLNYDRPGLGVWTGLYEMNNTLWASGRLSDLNLPEAPDAYEPHLISMPMTKLVHEPVVRFPQPTYGKAKEKRKKTVKNEATVSHETNDPHPIDLPVENVENVPPKKTSKLGQTTAFRAALRARVKRANDLADSLIDDSEVPSED